MDTSIKKFLSGYGKDEPPQDIVKREGDVQISPIRYALATEIGNSHFQRLIDIGCGNGIILYVLNDLNIFTNNPKFEYHGFDFKDKIKNAISLSLDNDVYNLGTFHSIEKDSWTQYVYTNSLLLLRNVLHELSIAEISSCLFDLANHLDETSVLIIQDMTTLPVAERKNAGWDGKLLRNMLDEIGFTSTVIPDHSRSGVELYILKCIKNKKISELSKDSIYNELVKIRKKQLDGLKKNKISGDGITSARLAHNIISIQSQLGISFGADTQEAVFELLKRSILLTQSELNMDSMKSSYSYATIEAFQDRGYHLQKIDEFLTTSTKPILLVTGAKLIGKKSLIYESLNRFKHSRLPVEIFCSEGIDASSVFEQILSSLDCGKFFDVELISQFEFLDADIIFNHPVFNDFIKEIAKSVIFIFKNFEDVAIDNDVTSDIIKFIDKISSFDNSKIIIDSDYVLDFESDLDVLRVHLFPHQTHENDYEKYQYIIHYFQETIPAKYRSKDFPLTGGFPVEILAATRFHPYYTDVISRFIRSQPDSNCLQRGEFINKCKSHLFNDILSAFNVSDEEKNLILLLSHNRGHIKEQLLDILDEYRESINSLISKGLLYKKGKSYYLLISSSGNIEAVISKEQYSYMAEKNSQLYKLTGDPLFLRDCQFFKLMIGVEGAVSSYYLAEYSNALHDFYNLQEYLKVISISKVIQKKRQLYPKEAMKYSSSLIREGDITLGIENFRRLFKAHPKWNGAKYSCIGSLFSIKSRYDVIQDVLFSIPEESRNYYWHGQAGRYFSIQKEVGEAINSFDTSFLLAQGNEEKMYAIELGVRLARTYGLEKLESVWYDRYKQLGEVYSDIEIEYATFIERKGNIKECIDILQKIYSNDKNNTRCVFALTKHLCTDGCVEKAKDILDEFKDRIRRNKFKYRKNILRLSEANILVAEEKFDEALSIIEDELRKTTDVHVLGQYADIYVKKSQWMELNSCQEAQIVLTAREGLKYLSKIEEFKNIPALHSCLRLSKICRDSSIQKRIEKIIHSISEYDE